MKWTLGWLVGCALFVLATPALAQGAAGDPAGEEAAARAGEHFRRGVELFRDGDYPAALVEFERADSIAPSYHVQFNIGQVAFELKDYARALRSYRRFLEEGGQSIPAGKRTQAEEAVAKLEERVGELSVVTNVSQGELLIDDTKVADLPAEEAILVSAGRRKVSIVEPGHPALTRFVEVAGGDQLSVELMSGVAARADVDEQAGAGEAAQGESASEQRAGLPTAFWVSAGLTAGLAAGATTFGILAATAKSSYQDRLDGPVADANAANEDWDQVKERALITDLLLGATAVAATVTVVIALTSKKKKEQPLAQLHLAPMGVGLSGSF